MWAPDAVFPVQVTHRGLSYELIALITDEQFDAFEDELNAFEALCQRVVDVENNATLPSAPSVAMWTELTSFTARFRLFEDRALFVAFEVRGKERELVWTVGMQLSSTVFGGQIIRQGFGMLERVHPARRRLGLSLVFMLPALQLLNVDRIGWGYVHTLNTASIARTTPLEQRSTDPNDTRLFVYGGHDLLVRIRDSKQAASVAQADFDFISAYFGGSGDQFGPSPTIWNEWRATGKLLGGFERRGERGFRICCVAFLCDWVKLLKRPNGETVAKNVVVLSNFCGFDHDGWRPVYDAALYPLSLIENFVADLQQHLNADAVLLDFDVQTQSRMVSHFLSTDQVVAQTREVYDIYGPRVQDISLTWRARFLDPRHTSSLLFFEHKTKAAKL